MLMVCLEHRRQVCPKEVLDSKWPGLFHKRSLDSRCILHPRRAFQPDHTLSLLKLRRAHCTTPRMNLLKRTVSECLSDRSRSIGNWSYRKRSEERRVGKECRSR